ncbi:MAG: hypothetical protein MK165_16370 [Pirellulaceae bacterium]|nr:hypothetical protein [Pirellulaceae bacterium]
MQKVAHWCSSKTAALVLAWLLCLAARAPAEDFPNWALPMAQATETIGSIVANKNQRKFYVGMLSRNAAHNGLSVFDLGDSGRPVGKSRK